VLVATDPVRASPQYRAFERAWVTQCLACVDWESSGGSAPAEGSIASIRVVGSRLGVLASWPYPGQHPAIIDADLWQAVQDRLAINLQGHRNRTNAAEPSLLAGLVFDDQGQRLSPSHSTKGARRYRYYVRPADAAAGNARALRIPAQELEDVVLAAIVGFLGDEPRLMALIEGVDADVAHSRLQGAAALAQRLGAGADRIEILNRLVARIAVAQSSIEIGVRTEVIWLGGPGKAEEESVTTIVVPVQLKRCGMAVRLIVRAPYVGKPRTPDPRLVTLLAKAQRWFTSLSSGRSDSVLSIAQEHRLASADVTRVVYLAFLASDIGKRSMDHALAPGAGC
jgi:site-specific DNA recombinase